MILTPVGDSRRKGIRGQRGGPLQWCGQERMLSGPGWWQRGEERGSIISSAWNSPAPLPPMSNLPGSSFPARMTVFSRKISWLPLRSTTYFAPFLDSVRPILLCIFWRQYQGSGRHKTCLKYMVHCVSFYSTLTISVWYRF